MKKFFAVVFVVLLLFSRLVAADDVTYNFSTLGSGVTFISRANSTVFANHSVHTWLGNLSSLEERLYFDDAAVRSKDFYANEFVPGLPASVLKDKGNKTYFYLRGNNYLLLDFNHALQKVVYGKEAYYAENFTYGCNFTVNGTTLNVSKVYRNTTEFQPKRKVEFTVLGGAYENMTIELEEGQYYRDIPTGLMIVLLAVYNGSQDNFTNLSISFLSELREVTGMGGYVVETAYGVNSTRTIGISSVMWEPNGDLRGFGFDYSTVTGFGKEFNLSRDCLYAPQRICNWNLTRNFSWTAPVASINLTVYCPPWPPASTNVTFNLSNYWNASAPRYCVNASDCNVSIDSCTNYSCTGIANATCENCTIGNYTGNITTTCVYSRQTGCDFQDLCKGTGFRYADAYSYWYCEDNFFQRQREGGESCSASYHCKSNTCSGTCTAYVEPTPNPFPSPTANITTPVPTAIPLRPPECVYDFECVDEWACTKDNCINEFCVHHALYGCALGVDCKEYGFVEMVNGSIDYCSPDGLWVPQKQLGESCRQNHECLSYYCESFVCNTPDKQSTQGLLDGVTGFISGIIGFFANLFN